MPGHGSGSRPRWSSLAREITVVLMVKAIALGLLWFAFFASPAARRLDAGGVAKSLLAPSAPQSPQHRTEHASRPASR